MMEQVNRTYRELCLELLKAWNRSEGGSYSDFGKAAEQIAKRIDAIVFANDSIPLQANAPDWRGLCEELTEYLALLGDPPHELVCRAQEALAQPEPEDDVTLLRAALEATAAQRRAEDDAFVALARWGRPAPAPAGEVGELVDWLRLNAEEYAKDDCPNSADHFTRAADLLDRQATACAICERERLHQSTRAADLEVERQAAPVPVAVSERLPQPEDCDAEGYCWWWYPPVPEQNYGYWIYEDNAVPERSRLEWPDSWLPATALPLPSGEVE